MSEKTTLVKTGLSKTDLANSRLYPNIKTPAQAAVILAKAQAYGLCPTTVADGLFFVGGKPALSAQLIATLVKRSGKYDFKVKKKTDEVCEIEFYELGEDRRKESLGVETFSMKMAQRAGLATGVNWKKFPEAMLWARCLTAGVRARCPDALGGNPVYSVEELRPDTEVDSEGRPVIEAEVIDIPKLEDLRALMTRANADVEAILGYHGVEKIEELNEAQRKEIGEGLRIKLETT